MPVTIKVNGTSNGLVHKGTTHFAKSTAPDVCKTPSPAGPVPIPYPIIISMSSDLANGTTTIKADGGNICANKGSEFSRCSGDEAGTAGGVVSNVNMKEATWILYSFDVKLDGKNACRFSDMMKMNHGNTICMNGVTPDQTAPKEVKLEIEACEERKKPESQRKKKWDDCQVEELCDMLKAFSAIPKDKIKKVSPSPSEPTSPDNSKYNSVKELFAKNFAAAVNKVPLDEAHIKSQFSSDCRYKKWNEGGKPPPPEPRNPNPPRSGSGGMNPDHSHDVGLGGVFNDVASMKWMNARVNTTAGAAMRKYKPEEDAGKKVTAPGCCD
jgi:hypothetical protein